MARHVTVRFVGAVSSALVVALLGLVLRRPALAAVAAALATPVAVGLAGWRWPVVRMVARPSTDRLVEGDELDLLVDVWVDRTVPWVDVELELAPGLRSADGVVRRIIHVPSGTVRRLGFGLQATSWGVLAAGRVRLTVRDRFGLFALSSIQTLPVAVRAYPSDTRLRTMARPVRTGGVLGAHLASVRGEGCEYADVRAWQPGDRVRMVNWRVSARRGATWVNERHPERAADAVLLLDDTSSVGPADDATLRRAVQAAMALAEGHLTAQDRVGLLAVGSPVRWLRPDAGARQLYAIVDTLLDCRQPRAQGVGRGGAAGFLGGLRPATTVVALTLLADHRIVEVLADLRRHGHHVIAVEPVGGAAEDAGGPAGSGAADGRAAATVGPGDPRGGAGPVVDALALRLWEHERRARREWLRANGVAMLRWDGSVPLGRLLLRVAAGAAGGRR